MTDTTTLDAAIEAAMAQTGFPDGPPTEHNRTYARALIAHLLKNMDEPPLDPPAMKGWDLAIEVIERRAGIEREKVYHHNDGN